MVNGIVKQDENCYWHPLAPTPALSPDVLDDDIQLKENHSSKLRPTDIIASVDIRERDASVFKNVFNSATKATKESI